jgi:hypothetical protein
LDWTAHSCRAQAGLQQSQSGSAAHYHPKEAE